jgi:hypothetical protein
MGPDVRTEFLKLRSARTEYRTLAGCIQCGRDGIVGNQNKVLFENGASGAGRLADIPHRPRTPCASRFPVSFAGINVAVLSIQRGTIYPAAAPKHHSVTATGD